jgi:gliding motility-associated-like protein
MGDSCYFTVTVTDDQPPVITCQAPVSAVTTAGKCDKDITLTLPTVKDNCSTSVKTTYIVNNPDNSIKGPFASTSLTYKFMVGVSQIVWTVTDDAGNVVQCYQEVRVTADNKDLIPNAGSDAIICEGSTFKITGATAAPNVSLVWTTNGTGTFSDPKILNPVYTPSRADILNGQIILTLTAYSECASAMDHMILTITPYPKIYAGPDISLCAGESLQITGATAENVASVRWTTTGKGTLSGSTMLHPAYKPAANEYGTLTFVVFGRGQSGCGTVEVSDTMKVIIHEPLVVKASDDISILYNTTTVLSVSVSQGSGVYSFKWKPSDKVYTYNTPRTETLPLLADSRFVITATDEEWGCTGQDSVNVTVKTNIDDLITIYNAISPNGDGKNDVWWVEGITLFPDNKVTIFNRWGDKVREFHKYDNRIVFWDGTNREGKLVSDGTYYYVLEIKDIKTYTGWIQVKAAF